MSTIKVNTITKRSGSTLTIGECGATVQLATGATQTGFGRTGTVDWCTTAKTSPFTAVSGNGYFVNTTSGAVTVTLPASPSAGDIVSVSDYAKTAQTNNITIGRNSSNIDGCATNLILDTKGIATTLVYVDGTKGWKPVNSNEVVNELKYVTATGGTVTTSGDFKIHTFTSDGTFCVSCAGNACGSNTVDYLVIAGGGAGGTGNNAGGGGAGGYRFSDGTASGCYSAGPAPLGASALPVSAQGYPITVGAGATAQPGPGSSGPDKRGPNGSNSVFSTITSAGGGGGAVGTGPTNGTAGTDDEGASGGSGGGGGYQTYPGNPAGSGPGPAGSGNTPPVSPPQGNNGGIGADTAPGYGGGGGGGAGAVGTAGTSTGGGPGGNGLTSCITASPVARGGGGGGGTNGPQSTGGSGGGGAGAASSGGVPGGNGTANTGAGGGGGSCSYSPGSCKGITQGGSGGSGLIVVRYKFQN